MAQRIQFQILRATNANRTSYTPAVGELLFTTDTQNLYIGDGSTAGGILLVSSTGTVTSGANVGTAGVGVFKQISSGELQLKNINAGSARISVTDDPANDEVDIDLVEGSVDHDALLNFITNEHIDHSLVNIIAGSGLTGGGDLTADRTLDVDESDVDHDALQNFVANEHIDHSTVTLTAGVGLSGGGDITTSRTIDLEDTAVTPGTYGDSNSVSQVTLDQQGRVTSASNVDIDHDQLTNFDVDEHRTLDDSSTTTTNLWSADKIQTELDEKLGSVLSINTQTGNYTIQTSDSASKILMNNSTPATVTLPNGLDVGFQVLISRINTGVVTISAAGTLSSQGTQLDLENTGCVATHIGSNEWLVEGRLV